HRPAQAAPHARGPAGRDPQRRIAGAGTIHVTRALRTYWCLLAIACAAGAGAQDAKPVEKKEPPRVLLVSAPGLVRGRTNKLVLRGLGLVETTAAWADDFAPPATRPATNPTSQPATGQVAASQPTTRPAVAVRLISKAKNDPPKPYEA